MTTDEMVTNLEAGQKVRRPGWPEGHYVEAEGTGSGRKVSQMTMFYHTETEAILWTLLTSYTEDFIADDFEISP